MDLESIDDRFSTTRRVTRNRSEPDPCFQLPSMPAPAMAGGHGIGTLIHYPIPPHLQQAYDGCGFAAGQFPIAERMANQVLSLPMGPQLQDADVETVIAVLQDAARRFETTR
jgi:hypothetical protein